MRTISLLWRKGENKYATLKQNTLCLVMEKFGPELWSEPKPIQLDAPGHQFRVWVWGLT